MCSICPTGIVNIIYHAPRGSNPLKLSQTKGISNSQAKEFLTNANLGALDTDSKGLTFIQLDIKYDTLCVSLIFTRNTL